MPPSSMTIRAKRLTDTFSSPRWVAKIWRRSLQTIRIFDMFTCRYSHANLIPIVAFSCFSRTGYNFGGIRMWRRSFGIMSAGNFWTAMMTRGRRISCIRSLIEIWWLICAPHMWSDSARRRNSQSLSWNQPWVMGRTQIIMSRTDSSNKVNPLQASRRYNLTEEITIVIVGSLRCLGYHYYIQDAIQGLSHHSLVAISNLLLHIDTLVLSP